MKQLIIATLISASFAAHAHNVETAPPLTVVVPVTSSSSHVNNDVRQHQRQHQNQHQKQNQHQSSNSVSNVNAPSTAATADSNNASQATSINYGDRPASTAFAPSIPPTVSCAGSVGIGGQALGGGVSFGTTRIDPECERRELARTAMNFGDKATAEEVLCGNADYRAARQRAGRPCVTVHEAKVDGYNGDDEIIKYRLTH